MMAGFLLPDTTTMPGGLVQFPVMARIWPCKLLLSKQNCDYTVAIQHAAGKVPTRK